MTNDTRRTWPEKVFKGICLTAVLIPLGILALLLVKEDLFNFQDTLLQKVHWMV